jgi:carbonic anhydrase/acetyltransferase-like protein (isoleucine patch superfamily)
MDLFNCVFYLDDLKKQYPDVNFGIECAIANPGYVKLGHDVIMAHHSSITAVSAHNGKYYKPSISVGPQTQIGPYNAFAAINKIQIGANVLFGPYVMVTDHYHSYEDVNTPIMYQPAYSHGPAIIEDDCWLGFGCHILSGVTVGKHCVIGANSVVTKNIEPFSVAVGSPAEIIKKYNFRVGKWEIIKKH